MTPDPRPRPASPLRRRLLALPLAAWFAPAAAQFRVEISGVGATQLPIAALKFRDEERAPQPVGAIVRADLERSGLFRPVDAGGTALDETSQPGMVEWRGRGADALLAGSVTRLADGRFDVRYRLWDVVQGRDLGGQSYPVPAADLRLAAHQVADAVYEKLTGEKGVFSTRIAYVSKAGGRHTLWIADADGEGGQSALVSSEPIISPAWSPDGRQLAVTLSRDGGSQLFVMARDGSGVKRLTSSSAIDTEAAWSPDGQQIYFVSDRGGSPQIYRQPAAGGNAERISFDGGYNISPAISPDGKLLAHVSRNGGNFRVHVTDLSGGGAGRAITDSSADESPSFAPNSRLLIYATRAGGRDVLMTSTADGRIKARLASPQSDVREPVWGPYGR